MWDLWWFGDPSRHIGPLKKVRSVDHCPRKTYGANCSRMNRVVTLLKTCNRARKQYIAILLLETRPDNGSLIVVQFPAIIMALMKNVPAIIMAVNGPLMAINTY